MDELTTLNHHVDGLLRLARPDRYEPGGDWLDQVAAQLEGDIPILEARRMAARQIVGQREGAATKRVNKFLKGLFGLDGQFALPVDWYVYADEPVALIDHSGIRIRVALRAMAAADWDSFVLNGRIDAQHRFDAEMRMYDAADELASRQGALAFAIWARTAAAA